MIDRSSASPRHSDADLRKAASAGIIGSGDAERLIGWLAAQAPAAPALMADTAKKSRFDLSHVLWYAGALIVMGAMGQFTTTAFMLMGGKGLVVTGLVYFSGLLWLGARLWRNEATRTPGGLLIAASIAMVPMIVYGVQEAAGMWAGLDRPGTYRSFYVYVRSGFIPMEIATIIVGALVMRRFPFAFIAFPVAVCLWFLSMDLADFMVKEGGKLDWELRRKVSIVFGAALAIFTLVFERRERKADYAFWLWLVAATTLWGGVSWKYDSTAFQKFLYLLFNIGLMGFAIFLRRVVFSVYGAIGIMSYLSWLAWDVFKDVLFFPFALSFIGLGVIALGIFYARRRAALIARVENMLPESLKRLRPAHLR